MKELYGQRKWGNLEESTGTKVKMADDEKMLT